MRIITSSSRLSGMYVIITELYKTDHIHIITNRSTVTGITGSTKIDLKIKKKKVFTTNKCVSKEF